MRVPVRNMETLLEQAKAANSKYIILMNGAHTAGSVKYFMAAEQETGDATLTTDYPANYDELQDEAETLVCIEHEDGRIECTVPGTRSCPPPPSCQLDTTIDRMKQ